jgi:hypothetical protein
VTGSDHEVQTWPPEGYDAPEAFAAQREQRKARRAKRWARDPSPPRPDPRRARRAPWQDDRDRRSVGRKLEGEPKPLWPGALEKGGRCRSCGQLEEHERPLLGTDERLHCPRLDCDDVVTIIDPGHPWLPGGQNYAINERRWDSEGVRVWKRHLHEKVVPARGTGSSVSQKEVWHPVPDPWVKAAWEKAQARRDAPRRRCAGCGKLQPKCDLEQTTVYVTSRKLLLGECWIWSCLDCLARIPRAATVDQVDSYSILK